MADKENKENGEDITKNLMEINKNEKFQEKEIKFISNICLYNYSQLILENGKDVNLYTIDMRPIENYKDKHFKNAIHQNDDKRLKDIEQKIQNQRNCIIVFYDEEEKKNWMQHKENKMKTNEKVELEKNLTKYYCLIQKYFRNTKTQFYILKEQFSNFEKEYPFLCLSEEDENAKRTNETTPRIIAYINYPLRILNNIYLGNFIHLNNTHIFHFLKIKHVYDFTASGFSKKLHQHVHYHRYDVNDKKLKKKKSENQTCNYLNFLDNHFMHDVICHIAKNDYLCQKWEGKMGGYNMSNGTNTKIKTTELNKNGIEKKDGKYLETTNESDKKTEMEITEEKRRILEKENKGINQERENENIKEIESKEKCEDINKENCGNNENKEESRHKKEQIKDNAIMILCNEGIKNQTKAKINSISLIICMCYVMFRCKFNVNVAIACFLKICNSLEINSKTFSFLKKFYNYLQKNNFCLEPRKEKKKENISESVRKVEHISQDTYVSSQNGHSGYSKERDIHNENIRHSHNSENNCSFGDIEEDKKNEISKTHTTDISKTNENVEISKSKEQNVISEKKKKNSLVNNGETLNNSLLDSRRNQICKQIMCSFDVHNKFIILGNNRSNVIYIPDDSDKNNNSSQNGNERNNESQKFIDQKVIIHNIVNKISYDHEQMLVSILYNIYNYKTKKLEDISIFLSVIFDAIHIEKYRTFVLMPYISLILFNICILIEKNINTLGLTNSENIKQQKKKIGMDIVFLLQIYAKESIIYLLHNLFVPKETVEFKITFYLTNEELRALPVDRNMYLILAALKYYLITLLHFYINPYIEKMEWSSFGKFNDTILKQINEFADYYYSKFKVDILKFLKPNYLPEKDSHDNLPFYFSDVLRPFILLNDYFA